MKIPTEAQMEKIEKELETQKAANPNRLHMSGYSIYIGDTAIGEVEPRYWGQGERSYELTLYGCWIDDIGEHCGSFENFLVSPIARTRKNVWRLAEAKGLVIKDIDKEILECETQIDRLKNRREAWENLDETRE